ncbi:MAG: DMT family transporter [Candidatus Methylophosphatis roskildensis]
MRASDLRHFASCVLIWSTTWIAITFQLDDVAPAVSIFWRFGLAALLLAAYCVARGFALRTTLAAQRELIAMGAFMFCGAYLLIYYAEIYLVSGLVAVGYSASPLVNMLTSRIAFGTRISRRVLIGGLLGLAGVVCVFWPEFSRIEADRGALLGAVFTAAGVLASAIGNVFSSRAQRHGGNVWQKMAWAMGWGACLAGTIALIKGESFGLPASPAYLIALLYLAIAGSIITFASYLTLLETIGAARAGYIGVIVPIVALAISSVFEQYDWHPLAHAGILLAVAGNVFILRRPANPARGTIRHPAPDPKP